MVARRIVCGVGQERGQWSIPMWIPMVSNEKEEWVSARRCKWEKWWMLSEEEGRLISLLESRLSEVAVPKRLMKEVAVPKRLMKEVAVPKRRMKEVALPKRLMKVVLQGTCKAGKGCCAVLISVLVAAVPLAAAQTRRMKQRRLQ
jgi:hypothetical protein